VPVPDASVERARRRIILKGDIPSPANPPSGCRFHTRCWLRERLGNPERCATEEPALTVPAGTASTGDPDTDHAVACHFTDEVRSMPQAATVVPEATQPA
jgi:oligopeptide/dipeptide ABC transporter ATP-binding protein